MKHTIHLPLTVVSESNQREHWAKKAARSKQNRQLACLAIKGAGLKLGAGWTVRLIRLGLKTLDDDNLAGAFKAVRDGIADCFGIADNDPRLSWEYSQREVKKKNQTGIEIELETN